MTWDWVEFALFVVALFGTWRFWTAVGDGRMEGWWHLFDMLIWLVIAAAAWSLLR